MTKLQYHRWKDFALRMARMCFKGNRRPSEAWIVEQVESWFWWRDFQGDHGIYNSWDQDKHPLCDHIAEFYDDLAPSSGRCKACLHECTYEDDCPGCTIECRCDEKNDLCYEQFKDQWLAPVLCCIRAGIDFACEPSAGVVGFTVGDLRRMYPEGIPDWISGGDAKWCPWLREHDESECHPLREFPDHQGIVL
jgi:hypothetical protein